MNKKLGLTVAKCNMKTNKALQLLIINKMIIKLAPEYTLLFSLKFELKLHV